MVGRTDGCSAIARVVAMRIDGLITGLHAVHSPEQLSRIERETTVSR